MKHFYYFPLQYDFKTLYFKLIYAKLYDEWAAKNIRILNGRIHFRIYGELMLDEHGHLIVDHDLDYIAEKFVEFARKQGFAFWRESYRYEATKPTEVLLAAEGKTKYGKNKTR